MPELPEVETVRRGLEGVFVGARFDHVEQRRPDLRFPFPERFVQRLSGQRIDALSRRAKYLQVHLGSGEVLIMHLGMSGRFKVLQAGANARKPGEFLHEAGDDARHDHVVFTMSNGATVIYNDARRFGFMALAPSDRLEEHKLISGLGVEPLGDALTPAYLAQRCEGKQTSLKAALLDQRIVAGLGNIYVCEALFRSGLSPRRKASSLAMRNGGPTTRANRLVPEIKAVLEDAIDSGGSTLRDYR
ncbi:MAG: bifunctional DNA-formamidopyrimidine glycosylase/DNA-(apurinic or apyrimidinic site) lyase, partial [Pseudomonadota bacterium]